MPDLDDIDRLLVLGTCPAGHAGGRPRNDAGLHHAGPHHAALHDTASHHAASHDTGAALHDAALHDAALHDSGAAPRRADAGSRPGAGWRR